VPAQQRHPATVAANPQQRTDIQALNPGERTDLDNRAHRFRYLGGRDGRGPTGQRMPDEHRWTPEMGDDAQQVVRHTRDVLEVNAG
jgi:hypothetical protein